jgi:acyl-CoA synthetase (AMP-forming)/AMP-acid ligase II
MLSSAVTDRAGTDAAVRSGNVATLFAEQAACRQAQIAIVDRYRGTDRVTTFGELDERGARLAGLLRSAGIGEGDVILLGIKPGLDLYAAFLAILRIGAVAMLVEPGAGKRGLVDACRIARPRVVLASAGVLCRGLTLSAIRAIPIRLTTSRWMPFARSVRLSRGIQPDHRVACVSGDAPAILTFTSGSTGQPKAAVRTHAILGAQHRALRPVAASAGEIDLVSLPVVVLANLAAGATSIVADVNSTRLATTSLDGIEGQIARLSPTRLTVAPVLVERLAREAGVKALGRLRGIVTGGGPLFPDVVDLVKRIAPSAQVTAVYGSTEAEPIAQLDATSVSERDLGAMQGGAGLLAGHPVAAACVRILRMDSRLPAHPTVQHLHEATMPVGEVGEIIVAGDHVVPGYLYGTGDAESKIKVASTVWHRTGDAGYFDSLGRLWLMGRVSAAIHDVHGAAYPFSIECAARLLTGSRNVALAAVHGARTLVVEGSLSSKDQRRLLSGLAWARLGAVVAVPRLPFDRRHASKIDYPALAALLKRERRRPSPSPR